MQIEASKVANGFQSILLQSYFVHQKNQKNLQGMACGENNIMPLKKI